MALAGTRLQEKVGGEDVGWGSRRDLECSSGALWRVRASGLSSPWVVTNFTSSLWVTCVFLSGGGNVGFPPGGLVLEEPTHLT